MKDSFLYWNKAFRLYGIQSTLRQAVISISAPSSENLSTEMVKVEDFLKIFGVSDFQYKALEIEFQSVFSSVIHTSNHPSGIKHDSGLILFSLIRICGLTRIYESGFQSGRSSQIILAAANDSSSVRVVSSDIRVREIPLPLRHSGSFELRIIHSKINKFWVNLNVSLKPELWFLDSDNRFHFQLAELRVAAKHSSFIVVNNSHVSKACDIFAKESQFERLDFLDTNRVLTVFARREPSNKAV